MQACTGGSVTNIHNCLYKEHCFAIAIVKRLLARSGSELLYMYSSASRERRPPICNLGENTMCKKRLNWGHTCAYMYMYLVDWNRPRSRARYIFPVLSPPSAQEYITRQSSSKSISLRMTGKIDGKCRTAGNSAKSFQLPASGPGIHTVPSILVGSSLARIICIQNCDSADSLKLRRISYTVYRWPAGRARRGGGAAGRRARAVNIDRASRRNEAGGAGPRTGTRVAWNANVPAEELHQYTWGASGGSSSHTCTHRAAAQHLLCQYWHWHSLHIWSSSGRGCPHALLVVPHALLAA
eukprot:COSAG02_NODE_9493_length_2198_cov_24.343927_2_plen_296_part_00